ncbi:hypothetical protein [Clostridium fessum]|jgi:vacuolar-type H+-ATPase subunit I/STV1|uniref:hypothetical protein n=1 Tax=Clostridium fessum TaxID=2126740 RepID=UPI00205DADBF|nr:MAG TPA: minor structural protein [Caudoviricetes sp.]
MIITDKLKTLGVEITDEIEKALAGDWVSESEVNKKLAKMQALEDENKELTEKQESLEKELQSMRDAAPDADALNQKIAELTATLENERKERAEKDERARLDGLVTEFFADKHFVNAITADAIKTQLVDRLNSDEARGKSISDLFDAIVKDDKGNYKPDILIDDKTFQAQQNRSQIVGNNINQPDGTRLSMAELMKLKNQHPDMDITPYLNRKKEK